MSNSLEKLRGYHFFTSSIAHWRTDSNLIPCLRNQRRADKSLKGWNIKGCNVYKVPGPSDSDYKINNFTPQVEGVKLIHYEVY